jgi:hypothetical protein
MYVISLWCSANARLVHHVKKLCMCCLPCRCVQPCAWRSACMEPRLPRLRPGATALLTKHTKQHVHLSSRFKNTAFLQRHLEHHYYLSSFFYADPYSARHSRDILVLLGCHVERLACRSLPRTHRTSIQPNASSKVQRRQPPYNYQL